MNDRVASENRFYFLFELILKRKKFTRTKNFISAVGARERKKVNEKIRAEETKPSRISALVFIFTRNEVDSKTIIDFGVWVNSIIMQISE